MDIHIRKPFGYSHQGRRQNQQDAMCPEEFSEETAWVAVCDGVGGLARGEIASELVCEAFSRMLDGQFQQGDSMDTKHFEDVLHYAYNMLYENRRLGMAMATTLAFLAITSEGVLLAHIGDSRIYQIRPGKGVVFMTEDHSLVRSMVKEGTITEEEAVNHEKRNFITRCLRVVEKGGIGDEATVDIIRDIEKGDIFLVCTDGVYGEIPESELTALLSEDCEIKEKADKLASITCHSNDNNTACLIEIANVANNYNAHNETYETSIFTESKSYTSDIKENIGTFFRKLFSKK